MTRLDDIRAAMQPRRESSGSRRRRIRCCSASTSRRVADLAHRAGARAVADNTFASPALQRPLDLGCDLVMHATTKYLGGRSDVMGGAVVTRVDAKRRRAVRTAQLYGGAVPSPFDCWLVMRSLPTLPIACARTAPTRRVATFLHDHPKVSAVHYPGLAGNPFHALAKRQMSDFGGMLSFETRGGKEAAMAVRGAHVEVFTRATSLGGVESLIEHRASIEGPRAGRRRTAARLGRPRARRRPDRRPGAGAGLRRSPPRGRATPRRPSPRCIRRASRRTGPGRSGRRPCSAGRPSRAAR